MILPCSSSLLLPILIQAFLLILLFWTSNFVWYFLFIFHSDIFAFLWCFLWEMTLNILVVFQAFLLFLVL